MVVDKEEVLEYIWGQRVESLVELICLGGGKGMPIILNKPVVVEDEEAVSFKIEGVIKREKPPKFILPFGKVGSKRVHILDAFGPEITEGELERLIEQGGGISRERGR